MVSPFALLSSVAGVAYAQYTSNYLPSNAPATSAEGQAGTNQCGTRNDQKSNCQNAYINGIQDFCLWGPPDLGPNSTVGETERFEVSWCLQQGYGTRTIPDGTITGAHFVKTPDFVQVTGVGLLTKINIPGGDLGAELDPHGTDGNGNPVGGLVFSSAFGALQQIHDWTSFIGSDQFCFRACNPERPNGAVWCQHIYDVMGCAWNMPANYDPGLFESCQGESGEPMGVYDGLTWLQGQAWTPAAHPMPPSSLCTTVTSPGGTPTTSTTPPSTIISPPSSIPAVPTSRSSRVQVTAFLTATTSPPSSVRKSGSSRGQATDFSEEFSGALSNRSVHGWRRYVFSAGLALITSYVGAVLL
ncbi:uncharacterized protein BT62DRAFT_1075191 [Guyanagaster necrorhizus]|uniref:Macrofage activating glycoprotein n=1 Tax=Guyanagaster necrorhizus TaxID=856835 RepID=A0A9P7VWA5_9AGAR|nr:uncharacterized protein BT62DRAFT_1075191 [Guyanagaster necrorhizus MCA 3950]KAG7447880.1 hypothetical protein BT62DRAFT_1075191 [Guyanagaster necrorhizus MCA 3950]